MDSIYNAITDIVNANKNMVIVTWDTLHMFMTLLIFIALIILIWVAKLDPCDKRKYEGKYEEISADKGTRGEEMLTSQCLHEASLLRQLYSAM